MAGSAPWAGEGEPMTTTKLVEITGDKDEPTRDIAVEALGDGRYAVTIGDETTEVEGHLVDGGVALRIGALSRDLRVDDRGDALLVRTPSGRARLELVDARTYALQAALGQGAGALKPELVSPMAGKVVLTPVSAGDEVTEGTTLVIVEAMKMENEIRAVADVRIKDVRVAPGDLVNPGDVLVVFDVEE